MTEHTADTWPHYRAGPVKLINHWLASGLNQTTTTLGSLTFKAQLTEQGVTDGLVVDGRMGESDVSVHLGEEALDKLLHGTVAVQMLLDLPELLAQALLEAALAPLTKELQEQLKTSFSVKKIRKGEPLQDGLHLRIEDGNASGSGFTVTLDMADEVPKPVLEYLKRMGKQEEKQTFPKLPVDVLLEAGYTSLPLETLKTLQEGDVVMCDECYLESQQLRININGYYECMAEYGAGGVTVKTQPGRRNKKETADAGVATEAKELPMTLVYVAGYSLLDVKEIERVEPGYALETGTIEPGRVDIMAQGMKLGTGELVKVNDRTGVRIQEYGAELKL